MAALQRIAVLGTGANGASIAADLTCTGHDVTLIDQWPENVEAMRAHGLRIVGPSGETLQTSVRALHLCEVATLRNDFDVVFLSVKAYDTRWACELIKPRLASDGVVVGIQNGMTTDDVSSIVGSDRSLGAVIGIAANMFDPGVVLRQTPPTGTWFALGSTDGQSAGKAEPVADLMRHSGAVEITNDITSAKWMKLVGNAGEFLPTAILDLPMLEGLQVPGIRQIANLAGREAIATALQLGHKIVPLLGLPDPGDQEPEQYSSAVLDAIMSGWALEDTRVALLQDWMKGRRGEGEDINGHVVEVQRRLGGRAPVNEVLVSVSRRIESGALQRGPENAKLLIEEVRRATDLEIP